ncbi:MAG: dTDP-4-dehydrorhamnose 3,5-epimerase [Flavobacteriales bacterium]
METEKIMLLETETFFIEGLCLIKPKRYVDERGLFWESFSKATYENLLGVTFVQDNVSYSKKNVLRGLHFQHPPMEQGKLVTVLSGKAWDVAVDIRSESPTYGNHVAVELDAKNGHQFYIPPGFAHGFLALEDDTIFSYKCTQYYSKENENTLRWNDALLGISWPDKESVILSPKDQVGGLFNVFNSPF